MTTTHDPDPTQARTATSDDCDAVFVSAPIGEGADAHCVVRVRDWTFTVPGTSGTEPEIPDAALAERLGVEVKHLRELSARHEALGTITPRIVDEAAANKSYRTTYSKRGRGRPGVARFYTEADALFLVTRSEAPKAVALTKEMIRVYMLARRGLLPPQVSPELVAEVASVRAAIARLEQELASGVIGPAVAEQEILVPLRRIASLRGATKRLRRTWRSRVERQLRNLLGHGRRGSTWARLDRRLLVVAQQQIGMWTDEAIAAARGRGGASSDGPGGGAQQSLPLDGAKGAN